MKPAADPSPLDVALVARRMGALVPVVAAATMPWLSGTLDNDGPSTATLARLDLMRYDDNLPLELSVLLGTVAVLGTWVITVWLLRDRASRRVRHTLGWLSFAGPIALVGMALAYADPDNGASPGTGLWLAGLAMPIVGAVTLRTVDGPPVPARAPRSGCPARSRRLDVPHLAVAVTVPLTFLFVALPWASWHATRAHPDGTTTVAARAITESLTKLGPAFVDDPRHFDLLVGGVMVVLALWAIACLAASVLGRRWLTVAVGVTSLAGPLTLHVLTRRLLAGAAEPGAALGLWSTTVWMPLVGALAVFAGRARAADHQPTRAAVAVTLVPLVFVTLALPWADGRNPAQYQDRYGTTLFDLSSQVPLTERADRVTLLIAVVAVWAVLCTVGTQARLPAVVAGSSLLAAVGVQLVTTSFLEPVNLVHHLAGAWLASGTMLAGGIGLAAWSAWSGTRSKDGLGADDPLLLELGER